MYCGTRWDHVLQVLVPFRLFAPGREWKLHRDWFAKSAMADLLGADFGLAEAHKLYGCHDRLLAYKEALFSHLVDRWRDMFNASFDVLLYDLTSTYFEIDAADLPAGDKRRQCYSRGKRPDCPQVVIALVVTPDGLPLAYEVLIRPCSLPIPVSRGCPWASRPWPPRAASASIPMAARSSSRSASAARA